MTKNFPYKDKLNPDAAQWRKKSLQLNLIDLYIGYFVMEKLHKKEKTK